MRHSTNTFVPVDQNFMDNGFLSLYIGYHFHFKIQNVTTLYGTARNFEFRTKIKIVSKNNNLNNVQCHYTG